MALPHSTDHVLRLTGLSRFTHASRLGETHFLRFLLDDPDNDRITGDKRGVQLDQNRLDYPWIGIIGSGSSEFGTPESELAGYRL